MFKVVAVLLLAGLISLLCLYLQENSDHLALLSVRVGEFGPQLRTFRKEHTAGKATLSALRKSVDALAHQSRSMQRVITARLESVEDHISQTTRDRRRTFQDLRFLKDLVAPDIDRLYKDVLYPSVQVSGRTGVGGGVIIHSRGTSKENSETYIITAFHVVEKLVRKEKGRETRDPVEVRFYGEDGSHEQTLDGELLLYDGKQDIALIRVKGTGKLKNVAKLASLSDIKRVRVFTPILTVGCPLGHDPLPSLGQISTLNKEVSGARFWMMNAPTIFGNSGGGVFHRETRELLGISAMICTYDNNGATPVPHLGIMVSLDKIYAWLDKEHYSFIYDPDVTPEECQAARMRARKSKSSPATVPPTRAARTRVEW